MHTFKGSSTETATEMGPRFIQRIHTGIWYFPPRAGPQGLTSISVVSRASPLVPNTTHPVRRKPAVPCDYPRFTNWDTEALRQKGREHT